MNTFWVVAWPKHEGGYGLDNLLSAHSTLEDAKDRCHFVLPILDNVEVLDISGILNGTLRQPEVVYIHRGDQCG